MMALYYILLMILGFIVAILTCGTTSKAVWQSTGRMFKKKGNGDITRTMGTKGPAINAPGIKFSTPSYIKDETDSASGGVPEVADQENHEDTTEAMPKPPPTGAMRENTGDGKYYQWNGKQWICTENIPEMDLAILYPHKIGGD